MSSIARLALYAAAGALVAGCQLFPARQAQHVPAPAQAAPVVIEHPAATHRFEFDPEHDTVVGQVQVTRTRASDTLPDVARRFNLGYEELVRANPGVDPWLPGENTEIVLPTQFVLPDGPYTGVVINLAAMRLYYFPPRGEEDALQTVITHPIAELYPELPVGVDVRVVNEPFIYGWQGDALYVQAYPVLEDDEREHADGAGILLNAAISNELFQKVKQQGAGLDLELVAALVEARQGIAVPVTRRGLTLERYLAVAPRVRNVLPEGSNWNGDERLLANAREWEAMRADDADGAVRSP